MQQLPLNIHLLDYASFINFYAAGVNQNVVNYFQGFFQQVAEQVAYVWAAPQQGRSHLLQACRHLAVENNLSAVYLPLKKLFNLSTEVLQNVEHYTVVCLDDIDIISGNAVWEEALFHFYNRLQMQQHYLLVSANCAPHELKFNLPDLQSRLTAATVFYLHPLKDLEKLAALQLRAKQRGLILSSTVGQFLLTHWPRDNNALFAALDKLDKASLVAQHNLTVPFVKAILNI